MGDKSLFNERLDALMKSKGISTVALSRDTGINKGLISRYRSGAVQSISIKNLQLIADALGVSPVWLQGIEDENDSGNMEPWSDASKAEIDISRIIVARLVHDGYTREKAERRTEQIMAALNIKDQKDADAAWNLMDRVREQLEGK